MTYANNNNARTSSQPFPARCLRLPILRCIILSVAVTSMANATAGTVSQEIQKKIDPIINYLNERNLKTVGVLKFRVKKPGQKTSDRVGPLNSLLADRLEVGLILGNPFDPQKQLKIIKDAGAQVADIPGASHLSEEGRAKFFGPQFRLSWGSNKAAADAFLTGVVQVHEDGRNATVGILCFNRNGGPLEKACDVFKAKLDSSTLSEMGESFVLRGAFDHGSLNQTNKTPDSPKPTTTSVAKKEEAKEQDAVNAAISVKTQQTSFPLKDADAPVRLEITYDNQPVTIETRDGQAFVAEPETGQQVHMTIVRTKKAKGRLGVVLKVNGENTLYRQTQRDLDCSKWILSEEHVRTVIRGYQIAGSNMADEFKVLSSKESASRAVDYGRSVGQIQLTVFREENLSSADDLPPAIPDDDEEDLAAMLRGVHPKETPSNLSALKHQLRSAGNDGTQTRGLIVQGQKTDNKIRTVTFEPEPVPVMSVTITYYSP